MNAPGSNRADQKQWPAIVCLMVIGLFLLCGLYLWWRMSPPTMAINTASGTGGVAPGAAAARAAGRPAGQPRQRAAAVRNAAPAVGNTLGPIVLDPVTLAVVNIGGPRGPGQPRQAAGRLAPGGAGAQGQQAAGRPAPGGGGTQGQQAAGRPAPGGGAAARRNPAAVAPVAAAVALGPVVLDPVTLDVAPNGVPRAAGQGRPAAGNQNAGVAAMTAGAQAPRAAAPRPGGAARAAAPPLKAGDSDPFLFAFHPSQFADPNRAVQGVAAVQTNALAPVVLNGDLLESAATAMSTTRPANSYEQAVQLEKARAFVRAMCTDLQANLWVATEGSGVQRYDPTKPPLEAWTQYTTKDGLGDDGGYAIACDKLGRIWVGHLNHGVSVFNGTKWQNFDVVGGVSRPDALAGPLGERVFHIAVDPRDGDVWVATSGGLSRYSESRDVWTSYTRADGLPSDQASSMAFDMDGNIYVATQYNGIAMADFDDDYKTWRYVTGPKDEPTSPAGEGIPSNLMNDIVVAQDGTVYAATDAGVAWSKDRGKVWQYIRGRDWADKVRRRFNGPPAGWSGQAPANLLSEDYSTAVAETLDGKIVIGHRQTAADQFDGVTCGRYLTSVASYAHAILATPYSLQGAYGEGISVLRTSSDAVRPVGDGGGLVLPTQDAADVHFPAAANIPSLADLNAELARMATVPPATDGASPVQVLDDDWRTQGDWSGRYGRYWSLICGIVDPGVYLWGASPEPVAFRARQGDPHTNGDTLRYWVSDLYTQDVRTLELPPVYADSRVTKGMTTAMATRRQAEFDDHGESMPMGGTGPGIWFDLSVPAGQYELSLYFIDDDSQAGSTSRNRFRDYAVEVVPRLPDMDGLRALAKATPLAATRVTDFWGGDYKRFLVRGPIDLTVAIDRNHAFNTTMSAVMLDLPSDRPPPYFQTFSQWQQSQAVLAGKITMRLADWKADPKSAAAEFAAGATELDAARSVSAALDEMRQWNPAWYAQNQHRVALMLSRWSCAGNSVLAHDDLPLEESWLYQAGLFSKMEALQRASDGKSARDMEHAMKWNPTISRDSGHEYEMLTGQILNKAQASIGPVGSGSTNNP